MRHKKAPVANLPKEKLQDDFRKHFWTAPRKMIPGAGIVHIMMSLMNNHKKENYRAQRHRRPKKSEQKNYYEWRRRKKRQTIERPSVGIWKNRSE
jgi:hypothetical protein